MSEHLKAFLAAYLEWVDAGAAHNEPFSRTVGLCHNLEDWMIEQRGFAWQHAEYEVDALKNLFVREELDRLYPFGGEPLYIHELENGAQHLNPARIAWVRSKVARHHESDLGRAVCEVRGGDAPTPKRAFA